MWQHGQTGCSHAAERWPHPPSTPHQIAPRSSRESEELDEGPECS
jgi:hypothetical protein